MTNKPTWEEDFDQQFQEVILDQEVRTVVPGIKNFISTKLAEQRKEIIEKILKIPPMWEEDEHEYLMKEITDLIKQD